MANRDMPMGLKPIKYLNGSPWNGRFSMYYKKAATSEAMFVGSPVKLAGSADDSGKYPDVALAGAGGPIVGAIVGFSNNPHIVADVTDLDKLYSPATESCYVAVADDPSIIFECQADSATTLTADDMGSTCDLTTESGNTTTGKSTVEVDGSEASNTSTLEVMILRVVDREDNEIGAHVKLEVLINVHAYGRGLGQSGI